MTPETTVLHYLGYDDDRGGIVSVIRALSKADRFRSLLGVNRGFVQQRTPPLETLEFPKIAGEVISLRTIIRARSVAHVVQAWLRAAPHRVFHGHSRAGLLVALWLNAMGERRAVVTVHCYGRQRWFYRFAQRRLGSRLYWLSPAMARYYGVATDDWSRCIRECVEGGTQAPRRQRADIVRFGGVGTLVPWKNWALVFDALALVPPTIRAKIRFDHLGSDDGSMESKTYARELRRRAEKEFPLNVRLLGQAPSSADLLASVDCLIVASKNEPFSVAMLEALHTGVPVLAADSGGASDLISPPWHGWLFRSTEARSLANELIRLVETNALVDVRFDAARLKDFSADAVAERCADIYLGVLQNE